VVIEHIIAGVKRCRIVKDVFRNTQEGFDDLAMAGLRPAQLQELLATPMLLTAGQSIRISENGFR